MFTSYARQNDNTYLIISQKLFKVQLQITNDLDTSNSAIHKAAGRAVPGFAWYNS